MPSLAFMMAVYPTEKVSMNMGFPQFSQFFPRFSTERKTRRLIREVKCAVAPISTVSNSSLKMGYSTMLFKTIRQGLRNEDV